ncbi:MAG: hypothetical protein ACPKPY_02070 [Nitrososphaeraceae archaeon]
MVFSSFQVSFSERTIQNNTILSTQTLNFSDIIFKPDSKPYNVTYSDWTAKWWQWAYSIPLDKHPAYDDDGKYCGQNQHQPVWFFPGSYEHPVVRTCEIPANTALLITILNSECSFADYSSLTTEDELRDCATKIQDTVSGVHASLDGVDIPNLENYRVQSNLFNFTLPENNILNLPPQTTQAVSDGNWLFIKPLPPGTYELKFKGDLLNSVNNTDEEFAGPFGWDQETTYILHIK